MRWSSILLCLAAYICFAASIPFGDVSKKLTYDSLPNPKYTPGKLCTPEDPYFEGYRYPCKIAYCTRHVTQSLKRTVASYYGVPEEDWSLYEFDHWYPLSIGGCNDERNLWPQPIDEAHEKDALENQLYHALSNGTMDQEEAVAKVKAWRPRVVGLIHNKTLTTGVY